MNAFLKLTDLKGDTVIVGASHVVSVESFSGHGIGAKLYFGDGNLTCDVKETPEQIWDMLLEVQMAAVTRG